MGFDFHNRNYIRKKILLFDPRYNENSADFLAYI